jgi:hypothetical protein
MTRPYKSRPRRARFIYCFLYEQAGVHIKRWTRILVGLRPLFTVSAASLHCYLDYYSTARNIHSIYNLSFKKSTAEHEMNNRENRFLYNMSVCAIIHLFLIVMLLTLVTPIHVFSYYSIFGTGSLCLFQLIILTSELDYSTNLEISNQFLTWKSAQLIHCVI